MRVGVVSSSDFSNPQDNPTMRMDAPFILFTKRLKEAGAAMGAEDVADLERALSNRTAVQAYQSEVKAAVTVGQIEVAILKALRLPNASAALRSGVARLAEVVLAAKIDAARAARDAAEVHLRELEQGRGQTPPSGGLKR